MFARANGGDPAWVLRIPSDGLFEAKVRVHHFAAIPRRVFRPASLPMRAPGADVSNITRRPSERNSSKSKRAKRSR